MITLSSVSVPSNYHIAEGATSRADFIDTGFWPWQHRATKLKFSSTAQPDVPEEVHELQIEGHLINSRRIDDHVHFTVGFTPEIPYPFYSGDGTLDDDWQQQTPLLHRR